MNYRMTRYIIGKIMRVEGVLMLLPLLCVFFYQEEGTFFPFLIPILLLSIVGTLLTLKPPVNKTLYAKEGFVIVGFSWILLSLFGALPYYLSGAIPSYVDCIFETVSGFTTTGASIVSDVELLPHSLLFWRSFTHWIGGMGVLVFVLAFLPKSDVGSSRLMHVMRAEVPGPLVGKFVSKIKMSARILYGMYIGMTIVEIVLLLFGGMNLFDSLVHAFGTAGTGGFSSKNLSVAFYNSAYIDYVISIFMVLFGINFNLFYLLLIGQGVSVFKSEELWCYLGVIGASILCITINIVHIYPTVEESFRHAFFQTASIISTTGFSTTNFNNWPELSRCVLVCLMFIGACAGSTGGGIKVSRVIILVKTGLKEIRYMLQPRSVVSVKFESKPMKPEIIRATTSFLIVYIGLFTAALLLITAIDEFDLITGFTAVASCLNNIGPGLEIVGPVGNYSIFHPVSKLILSFVMLAGRLEIFPILLLFAPTTWKHH